MSRDRWSWSGRLAFMVVVGVTVGAAYATKAPTQEEKDYELAARQVLVDDLHLVRVSPEDNPDAIETAATGIAEARKKVLVLSDTKARNAYLRWLDAFQRDVATARKAHLPDAEKLAAADQVRIGVIKATLVSP